MKVVLRTHGGLGNQIFQVLFARLYAGQCNASMREIHDAKYTHRFARSKELGKGPERTSFTQRVVSSFRLPKVMNRVGLSIDEKISLFGTAYLDGYFQAAYHYKLFKPEKVTEQLIRIRDELMITTTHRRGLLVHLRLGDFFDSTEQARLFTIKRLRDLQSGSTIITNQESLLAEPELQSMLANTSCKVQTTDGLSPEAIIRLMSQFEQIDANDSTLAFWASVLGGCRVEFTNLTLRETCVLFKGYLNS